MIIIEIFEEEPQLGCGGLIVLFLLIFGISKCSSCSSTHDNKSIDGIKVESPSYTPTPQSTNSNYGLEISQILNGTWSGTITQSGYNNYKMIVHCDWTNRRFAVEYPTLRCGGNLILQSCDTERVIFIEQTNYGLDRCTNGDKIVFEKKSNNNIRVSVYLSSSNFLYVACSGELHKQ
jgi:hypothetical protein